MKTIGMLQGMELCRRYQRMDAARRREIREARLRALVGWARKNSPVYRELYREVGPTFTLADLPPVNKGGLMPWFDHWVTDPTVTMDGVEAFMENRDNIGRRYLGKYLVFTTSGSTGTPLVCLCDKTTENMMGAINTLRSFARRQDFTAFLLRGGKSMGVFATGGFYLSNSSVRARLLAMPWKKNKFGVTSALLPTAQIVEELNRFRPVMLGGYPSNLELLAEEQREGRLHIRPTLVMTGGEYLSDTVREALAGAFGCTVQTSYSCTEGGTIACECPHQRFHINEDWLLVEPVDANNRPVPAGRPAEKILLTNLFNYTQPFIRYEVTDRVVLHDEPCPCGSTLPWLTLEGRTDDVARFVQNGREVRIPPLTLYATLKEIRGLCRFQVVVYSGNRVELRLEGEAGRDKTAVFLRAEAGLRAFLAGHGVTEVEISAGIQPPAPHPESGKFKHVMYVD